MDQNRGYSENESEKQYQCNPVNRANSVCRCCCETTECNENAEFCIKPPECSYPEITNGRFVCENSGNIGDQCDIICDDGFECHGEKRRTLECHTDGTWTGVVPSCEPIPTTTIAATTTKAKATTTTKPTNTTTTRTVTTRTTQPVTTQSEPLSTKPIRTTNQIQSECSELETGVIGLMVRIKLLYPIKLAIKVLK